MVAKLLHLSNVLRSGVYLFESLPLRVLHRFMREHGLPDPTPEQMRDLLKRMKRLFAREEQYVRDGVYDWRAFEVENPLQHVRSWAEVLQDGIGLSLRRYRKQHDVFNKKIDEHLEAPEYYRRNFHFQTDGYFSEASARRYDHQVEILFNGTGATMRRRLLPILKRYADPKMRWLDLGCGTGSAMRAVCATFPKTRVVGLDLSSAYVKVAGDKLRQFPRASFIQGDGTQMDFKDETFGAVFSVYCLHELPKVERERFVREAYRVLKPGGVLIMADSLQVGDDPAVDFTLERFPIFFHEPFFKNYTQDRLEDLMGRISGQPTQTDLALATKFVWLTKTL